MSAATRIEVVTEGILTRMIQADPALAGVGTLIFDEFHERSIHADLGLALAWEARGALRPDLRLVVMSATLEAGPVAALLDDAPVVTAAGRAFPVETRWLDRPVPREARPEAAAAELVLRAVAETAGGVLVFLPARARSAGWPGSWRVGCRPAARSGPFTARCRCRPSAPPSPGRRGPQAGAGDRHRRDLADDRGRPGGGRRRPGAAGALRPGSGMTGW